MEITLPLKKMSVAEKLRVMEMLWDDLAHNEKKVKSPEWHGEILRERADRVERGEECFIGWKKAKQQLRRRTRR